MLISLPSTPAYSSFVSSHALAAKAAATSPVQPENTFQIEDPRVASQNSGVRRVLSSQREHRIGHQPRAYCPELDYAKIVLQREYGLEKRLVRC